MGKYGRRGVPPGSTLQGHGAPAEPPPTTCRAADWWDPAWDAAWWDPLWAVVRSAGTVAAGPATGQAEFPPDISPHPMAGPQEAGRARLVSKMSARAPAEPAWGHVLATTVSLWVSRRWSAVGRPGRFLRPAEKPRRPSAPGLRPGSRFRAVPTSPARLVAVSVLGAGLLAVGAGAAGLVAASGSGAPVVRLIARPSPVAVPSDRTVTPVWLAAAEQIARPVWLSIPALGVRAQVVDLGLNPNGTLQVPATTTVVGWYANSPQPGAIGPAVIAGHVDSRAGPGVFFWLRTLRPGQRIYVGRADGTMAVFIVTSVRMYAKDQFPTTAVYGPVPDAELRLITCGGTFDEALGRYLSNVVVYARLADA